MVVGTMTKPPSKEAFSTSNHDEQSNKDWKREMTRKAGRSQDHMKRKKRSHSILERKERDETPLEQHINHADTLQTNPLNRHVKLSTKQKN